ncbi:helix-turn-helix domain-containing protein [Paenibacillus cymbidii]|uniref:helix-turn-helix domain-containing protein n=1 Tax=Paenibacillus cymbidii TaxID=1639034 RepID=UPI001081B6B0|nr:helix-turn-helix domain-containing protein [Paenibacillus cymbidii]
MANRIFSTGRNIWRRSGFGFGGDGQRQGSRRRFSSPFRHFKLHFKLIVSFSFVCLLALSIFSSITVMMYKNILIQKETSSALRNLKAFQTNLDSYLKAVDAAASTIVYNPGIQSYFSIDVNQLPSAERLAAYNQINDLLKQTQLNNIGLNSISIIDNYNNYFSFTLLPDKVYSQVLAQNVSKQDVFRQAILENTPNYWLINDWANESNTISLIRPIISTTTLQPLGFLVITISPELLNNYFNSTEQAEGDYILLDDKGALITGRSGAITQADSREITANEGHYAEVRDGKRYIITYVKHPSTGWLFMYALEEKKLFHDIGSINRIWVVVFVVTFTLVALLSLLIARSMAKPLRKLTKLHREVQNGNLDVAFRAHSRDEIGLLGESFNDMVERIRDSLPLQREKLIRSLLEGNLSGGEIKRMNRNIGLPLQRPFFQVAILDSGRGNVERTDETIATAMQAELAKLAAIEAFCYIQLAAERFCLILNEGEQEAQRIVGELVRAIGRDEDGLQVHAYFGNQYDEVFFVKQSFEEAKQLMQYRLYNHAELIGFNYINSQLWQVSYPETYESRLLHYIETADLDKCRLVLAEFETYVVESKVKPASIMIFIQTIYTHLCKTVLKHGEQPEDWFGSSSLAGSVREPTSIKANMNELDRLIAVFITTMRERAQVPMNAKIQRAIAIIEREYNNPDLSTEFVAAAVELHAVYFSQLFKKETGVNFGEFLSELRLGKAKDQLRSTALKIKEIAVAVGYMDSHYFGVWFKEKTGLTPSQYRKIGMQLGQGHSEAL